MVDWTRPLRQADGTGCSLVARIVDGEVEILTARTIDNDTIRHFKLSAGAGVEYMVQKHHGTPDPIYYRADGTPWQDHHPAMLNSAGEAVPFDVMRKRVDTEKARMATLRKQQREAWEARRSKSADEVAAKKAAEIAAQDAIEANPLWGLF